MTLLTLVRRNLMRRKARSALTLAAVIIAFLLFGLLAAVRTNFDASSDPGAAGRLIVSSRVNVVAALPLRYVDEVRQIVGVREVGYRTTLGGFYRERRNVFLLLSTEPRSFLALYPDYVVDAAARQRFLTDRNSVLLGAQLADRFGLHVGQTVPLGVISPGSSGQAQTITVRIAGIFRGRTAQNGTGLAIVDQARVNDLPLMIPNTANALIVQATDANHNDALAAAIDQRFANSAYETKTMSEESFNRALVAQIGNISLITMLVVGAGFFAILMVVGSAIAAAVRERTREIGILRTLGFSPRRVMALVLAESAAITIVGGAIGLTLAQLMIGGLRQVGNGVLGRLTITGPTLLLGIALMLLFGIVAGALPALGTMRIDVASALSRRQ